MFLANRWLTKCLQLFWIIAITWYELGVFFSSVRDCDWPDAALLPESSYGGPRLSHILLIADPQILDHRSYDRGPYLTYLTQLIVDLNLRKNWYVALRKQPDAVIFLGDMMDGGRFNMSDDEYEQYYSRFRHIFNRYSQIPMHFIPGNHDVGLRVPASFSPHAHARFISHFGLLNSQLSIANHTLVLLDAPSLVDEDIARMNHGQSYKDWMPVPGGSVEFIQSISKVRRDDPVILLTHIPLYRDNFECGILREKGTIRPGAGFGYQNTLGKEVTTFLLDKIQPSVIFSGDDHDYCENIHSSIIHNAAATREVSVKSFSMAMGIRRPGFQLLSLAPEGTRTHVTHADVPCLLPDQIDIYLSIYVPLLLFSLLVIFVTNGLRLHTPSPATRSFHDRGTIDEINNSIYLPPPVSALSPTSHVPRSWSFVLLGRRRRITLGTRPRVMFSQVPLSPWSRNRPRKHKYQSFLYRFFQDVRDVAVPPLILFVAISLWITR